MPHRRADHVKRRGGVDAEDDDDDRERGESDLDSGDGYFYTCYSSY